MALKGIKRPGQTSGGGGYLNGVSGTIQSLTFKAGKSGETKKGGTWTLYSGVLTIQADGADKPVQQFLDGGFLYGDNVVSEDGKSIEGTENYILDGSTPLGKFIISVFEGEGNKAPEELWDGTNQGRNYDNFAGMRVTFRRQRDEELTKAKGMRKVKTGPHAGKEFPQDVLLVAEVLALPAAKAAKGKGAKAGAKATGSKANVEATSTADADAALVAILTAAPDRTIARASINSALVRYSLLPKVKESGFDREAVRKILTSDDYIADAVKRELIVVDADTKGSPITLVA